MPCNNTMLRVASVSATTQHACAVVAPSHNIKKQYNTRKCLFGPSAMRGALLLPGACDALVLQPKARSCGHTRRMHVVVKASNEDGNDNSQRGSPPPRSKGPWEWLQQLVTFVRIQQPAKLVLNLLLGFFLVRLLPLSGRPSTEGHAVTVQVGEGGWSSTRLSSSSLSHE